MPHFLRTALLSCFLVLAAGCGSTPSSEPAANPDVTPAVDASVPIDCGEAEVVRFTTSDDVELVADYIPPSEPGRGVVVFFHMIPPSNDRTGFPLRVRESFSALGLGVLNVDRRGAGDSAGVALEAYEGPTAGLDVEAALRFVLADDRACVAASEKIMVVGASNGTTSVMDYVVNRSDASLPMPAAIAWLSPGSYTENQNSIADHNDVMSVLPVLTVHPANETWVAQFAGYSDAWKIVTLANGRHGTQILKTAS
ncbi:MAG: hypothetical protein GY822_12630 [Deltaproteobacteria bacterium]|nr:hypothetical protein [Deltaproteobacteria bacterium]